MSDIAATREGWVRVRIDTDPGDDGWCFCTPAAHPDDGQQPGVEDGWNGQYQFFGKVEMIPFTPHPERSSAKPNPIPKEKRE